MPANRLIFNPKRNALATPYRSLLLLAPGCVRAAGHAEGAPSGHTDGWPRSATLSCHYRNLPASCHWVCLGCWARGRRCNAFLAVSCCVWFAVLGCWPSGARVGRTVRLECEKTWEEPTRQLYRAARRCTARTRAALLLTACGLADGQARWPSGSGGS